MPYSSIIVEFSRNKAKVLDYLEKIPAPVKANGEINKVVKSAISFHKGKYISKKDLKQYLQIKKIVSDNLKIHIQGHPKDTHRLFLLLAWATKNITDEEILEILNGDADDVPTVPKL